MGGIKRETETQRERDRASVCVRERERERERETPQHTHTLLRLKVPVAFNPPMSFSIRRFQPHYPDGREAVHRVGKCAKGTRSLLVFAVRGKCQILLLLLLLLAHLGRHNFYYI